MGLVSQHCGYKAVGLNLNHEFRLVRKKLEVGDVMA
jgi:hypothetical protein